MEGGNRWLWAMRTGDFNLLVSGQVQDRTQMLYRRGVYQRALSLVQEAGTKLRDSPEIQYHLGMAYLKTGDKENARKALASATAVTASFSGKEEAKKALSELR